MNIKNYDSAIADFDQVLKYDEKNAEAFYLRGACYFFKENYRKCIEDMEKAVELDPNTKEYKETLDIVKQLQ